MYLPQTLLSMVEEKMPVLSGPATLKPQPNTTKANYSGKTPFVRYGMSLMQGYRKQMEDYCTVVDECGKGPLSSWSWFAVVDGHGGSKAAQYAANQLHASIFGTKYMRKVEELLNEKKNEVTTEIRELVWNAIKKGFIELDKTMRQLGVCQYTCGAVVACAIVTPGEIFIANLGDSRALLSRYNRSGKVFSTVDHIPKMPKETERIINAGGHICRGRVNGILAMSRALGDFTEKSVPHLSALEQPVTPEPNVYCKKRNLTKDEFLVLGSDGVFDVMRNRDLIRGVKALAETNDNLTNVGNCVLDRCLRRGSTDNMSIIIVHLPPMKC